ncbi:tripartite tricarboxylate transporter TctB family protein [Brevibacterium luteolum]|uniref:DUF1468 domain-containing protein n=1 Tax=Brevibacterium luteolum TaxID=199591 RepID=A0A2N6PHD4_9MICO|nr:tripartite tricarboxylate transporter TctB family protein [Brevibacterium luteolum]PMB98096.1 hypothetical protein CJ198_06905 [Brevibacterium luteolum]
MSERSEEEYLSIRDSPTNRLVLRLVPAFLAIIGAVQLILSMRIGLGELRQPGPGLWPAVTGVALLAAALFGFFLDGVTDYEKWSKRSLLIVAGIAMMGLYIPVMLSVGFLVSSAMLTTLWLRFFSRERWIVSLLLGVVGAGLIYVIFDLLLGVPLPSGPWGA